MPKKKVNKPKTHVVLVLDRSGSMGSIARQAINHFNEQRQQAILNSKDQDITVSLVTFNADVFEHAWLAPAEEVGELDADTYRPSGGTAWYDALGYAVDKLKATTEDDENTAYLVVSITDGDENSSSHYGGVYDSSIINALIEECQGTNKWTFTFMGCDANKLKQVSRATGIPMSNMALWSGDNAQIAEKSLHRSTERHNAYYACRTRGVTASNNMYSESDGLAADFTSDDSAALVGSTNQPIDLNSQPQIDLVSQPQVDLAHKVDPDWRSRVTAVTAKQVPFGSLYKGDTPYHSFQAGNAVSWNK